MSYAFKCSKCGVSKPRPAFFTAKTRRGHFAECRECCYERGRKYRAANRESCYATRKKYALRNKDKIRALTRKSALKTRYGISVQEFERIFKQQHGRCAICGEAGSLCVDHCHATGRVRGLLCDKCNRGIGAFNDDAALFIKAAQFIQAYIEARQIA